jgi:protein TonB
MMSIKPSKFLPGLLAVGIYVFIIALLIFYFNTRTEDTSKKYVKKNEHRIQVALSGGPKAEKKKSAKKKAPAKPKKSVQKKVKPKPKKSTKKKVIKEKIVKKKVVKKKPKPKKNHTKDLFANVKTPKKKNIIKVTDKPIKTKPKSNLIKVSDHKKTASERINDSLKQQKSADQGVENAYLAKVQSLLEGWPAQSEYAGEKVKVVLFIHPNGFFEFKIKSASRNANFNSGLTEYLEQLQEFGFGRHRGKRTYNFEAEFIAKE